MRDDGTLRGLNYQNSDSYERTICEMRASAEKRATQFPNTIGGWMLTILCGLMLGGGVAALVSLVIQ